MKTMKGQGRGGLANVLVVTAVALIIGTFAAANAPGAMASVSRKNRLVS